MVTFIFYFNFVWTCGVGRGGFIMKWLLSCFCFLRARFDVDVAFFWFCDFCFHDWIFVARKIMWIKLIMNGSHHRNQVRHWYSFSIDVVYTLPLEVNLFFGIDLSAEPVNDEFGQRQNKPRRQVDLRKHFHVGHLKWIFLFGMLDHGFAFFCGVGGRGVIFLWILGVILLAYFLVRSTWTQWMLVMFHADTQRWILGNEVL